MQTRDKWVHFVMTGDEYERMRRKTLLNALSASFGELSKEQVEKCLLDSGIDPKVRGEVLSIGEFAKIADAFFDVLD